MKLLLLLICAIQLFAFGQNPIKFNDSLNKEIVDVVELVYKNTNDMRRFGLYVEVSENKDYEMAFIVDSKDVQKSQYTVIILRSLTTNNFNDKLFAIKIERDGQIYLVGDDNLLSMDEILKKQPIIIKFLKEVKAELNHKLSITTTKENAIRNKFMEMK